MQIMTTKALVALSFLILITACGGSSSERLPPGVSVDTFTVDSSMVQSQIPVSSTDGCTPTTDPAFNVTPSAILGYRTNSQPTKLVVFAHGYGSNGMQSYRSYVTAFVSDDVAAMASSYRDDGGFPALRGAVDIIAATQTAMDRFPSIQTVYLFGLSMGAVVSGTAITESALVNGGQSLFDYWLAIEGVSSLSETYLAAETVLPIRAEDIVREVGGTPSDCPAGYQRRSPVSRAAEMQLAGLKAAFIIHGGNDGVVPYNQAESMAEALQSTAIPTQFYTVLRVAEGTSLGITSGDTVGAQLGIADPAQQQRIAGHTGPANTAHPIIAKTLEKLAAMLAGTYDDVTPAINCIIDEPSSPPERCSTP